jgi:hypothetical protein
MSLCPPSLKTVSLNQIYKNIVGRVWRVNCIEVLPQREQRQVLNRIAKAIKDEGLSQKTIEYYPQNIKSIILEEAYDDPLFQKFDEVMDYPEKTTKISGIDLDVRNILGIINLLIPHAGELQQFHIRLMFASAANLTPAQIRTMLAWIDKTTHIPQNVKTGRGLISFVSILCRYEARGGLR